VEGKYIDFHAHILPGADHGSDGIETSMRQLEIAEETKISCIVATPHFYPERHGTKSFFLRREEALSALLPFSGELRIVCGAEVGMCEGIENFPELDRLKIGESSAILIEMPDFIWSEGLLNSLLRLKTERGLNVILAHADRYGAREVEGLFSLGIKGQLNASAFASLTRRRRFYSWIDEGSVVALGSDVHGVDKTYGGYSRAVSLLGERGERLQNAMRQIIIKAGVNDTEGLPDVFQNK
jgi:protein-tyrosine phosphatase